MMQTVQLAIADAEYAAIVREALSRNCAWHVDAVKNPDLSLPCVVVLDEVTFARLLLPLAHPERVVLITRKDPQLLAQAWDAGIVSVVSMEDPVSTVLLAIMSAALRVTSGFSPSERPASEPLPPHSRVSSTKRCKIQ
jgi:hypothetical protein